MKFEELGLIEPLLVAVKSEGYDEPTPIQAQAIPHVLAGKDLLGIAQTGTGKTAAFTLPILQFLWTQKKFPARGKPRALILAPTRELAAQIGASIAAYGRNVRITHTVIFGGVGQQPQVDAVRRGVDIVVATPGRLLDLMQQGHVHMDLIEFFVLDEADRMLDMGFIQDVRKIIARLPQKRHSMFFSATMPPEVARLSSSILRDPVRVEVTPQATTVERIDQKVLYVDQEHKDEVLGDLLKQEHLKRVLVFTRTKHRANKVSKNLNNAGVRSDAIHGNKSQTARTKALSDFRSGRLRVLVATDIAARGIDVEGISHVINYDMPNEPESYVHRIGRTARAGADGTAYSLCAAEERGFVHDVEKLTRQTIEVMDHPRHSERAQNSSGAYSRSAAIQSRGRQGGHRRGPSRHGPPRHGQPNPGQGGARKFRRRF